MKYSIFISISTLLSCACATLDDSLPADTDTVPGSDSDTGSYSDTDTDADSDSDTDTDADADTDTDTDADTDSDSDSYSDTDADTDADTDTNPVVCTADNQDTVCSGEPCVDGYCCDEDCEGLCRACNMLGDEGICSFTAAGLDLEGECAATEANTCGTVGNCDGKGGCDFHPAGTIGCTDGLECTEDDACDGAGNCAGTTASCAPGAGNECCEGTCDDSTGCSTIEIPCPDICSDTQLEITRTCSGCGDPLQVGICSGGIVHACNAGTAPCSTHECNGADYYCTNDPDDEGWNWRTTAICNDGEDCTKNDICFYDNGLLQMVCRGTDFSSVCVQSICNKPTCDGLGGCIDDFEPNSTDCGDFDCPLDDECGGAGATLTYQIYPDYCDLYCQDGDSAGTCEADCTCSPNPGANCTDALPPDNDCCSATCVEGIGCGRLADNGQCTGGGVDVCGTADVQELSASDSCDVETCGCIGAQTFTCDGNPANAALCEIQSCGSDQYYCSNGDTGDNWRWVLDTGNLSCNDDACTSGQTCRTNQSCGDGTAVTCSGGGCCEARCDSVTGCSTVQATEPAETCGESELLVNYSCSDTCGDAGDSGTWLKDTHACDDATTANHCRQVSCGGNSYYCTNFGGLGWKWQFGQTICDDGVDCTHGETCDGAGGPSSCNGGTTPQCPAGTNDCTACNALGSSGCSFWACNGSTTCEQQTAPGSNGTFCTDPDSDPCTYDFTCLDGDCNGSSNSCPTDTACRDHECDGDGGCTYTDLDGSCTYADACYAGSCSGGECNQGAALFSCNDGTCQSACGETEGSCPDDCQTCPSSLSLATWDSGDDGWSDSSWWVLSSGYMHIDGSKNSQYDKSLTSPQVDLSDCSTATFNFSIKLDDYARTGFDIDKSEQLYVECLKSDSNWQIIPPGIPSWPPNQSDCSSNAYCDGGPSSVRTFSWTSQSLPVPSSCLLLQSQFRFRANGKSTWNLGSEGWGVDSVSLN